MPVDLDDLELVEPAKSEVDLNDLELVATPQAVTPRRPVPLIAANSSLSVEPIQPARSSEEQIARRLAGEQALGTAIPAPKVGGFTDSPLQFQKNFGATVQPNESVPSAVVKSLWNVGLGIPEFATSPLGVAASVVGPVAPRVTSGAFSVDMMRNAIKELPEVVKEWDKLTPAKKWEAAISIGANALLGIGLGVKTIKGFQKKPLGLTDQQHREAVEAVTKLAEENPQFKDMLQTVVEQPRPVEERLPGPTLPPPVLAGKPSENAPETPKPAEAGIPETPTPAAEAVTAAGEAPAAVGEAIAPKVEAVLAAAKVLPQAAAEAAKVIADEAVKAGREKVEAASEKPAELPSPERPPQNPSRFLREGENMNEFLHRATDEELKAMQDEGYAYEKWLREEQDYRKKTNDETWQDLNPYISDANHFASGANWELTRRMSERQAQQPAATEKLSPDDLEMVKPAEPSAQPKEAPSERPGVPALDRGLPESGGADIPELQAAIKIAERVDPNNVGPLLQAFRQVHKAGYTMSDAMRGAWSLYAASAENPSIKNYSDFKNSYAAALEAQMQVVHDALQKKEASNAQAVRSDTGLPAKTGQVIEGGEANRGQNVEQTPPGQSEPVVSRREGPAQGEVVLKPEGPVTIKAYHGSPRTNLKELEPQTAVSWGTGVYATTKAEAAGDKFGGGGGKVYPVEITLNKPFRGGVIPDETLTSTKAWSKFKGKWDDVQDAWNEEPDFRNAALKELGYDGVIADHPEYGQEVVAFNKAQVKMLEAPAEPPKAKATEAKAKEPWEMTQDEWFASKMPDLTPKHQVLEQSEIEMRKALAMPKGALHSDRQNKIHEAERAITFAREDLRLAEKKQAEDIPYWERKHREAIVDARDSGKIIPPEVLADYPDLKPTEPAKGVGKRASKATLKKDQAQAESDFEELYNKATSANEVTTPEIDAVVSRLSDSARKRFEGAIGILKHIAERQPELSKRAERFQEPDQRPLDLGHPPEETLGQGLTVGKPKASPREGPGALTAGTPTGPGLSGSVGAAAASSHIRAGEAPPEFYEGTSLKNAVADVERASYGLPEATPAEKRKMAERWIDSGAILDKDPTAGVNIVQRLKTNPETGLSDTESALVLREKVRLENNLNAAAERTFKETDPALKAQAQGEWDAASKSLLELLNAAKSRGSSWGREGRWRQAVAYEDMSFAAMETRMRMNRGGAELSMDERTKLKAMADQYKAESDRLQAELSGANERNRRLDEAVAELNRQVQARPRFDQKVLDYAESIVSKMENAADKARERILARRREGRLYAGVDPEPLADYAIIGAAKIARGLNEFAVWSDAMVKYLGDFITGDLPQIWDASQKQYAATLKTAPDPVQKALKTMTPDAKIEAWGKQIEKRLAKAENADVHAIIQKIGRALVERGVRTRDALVDGVFAITQKVAPKMTRDQVMDAISGYGDFSPLTKDATSVIYRDLKGQLQQVGKLRDMAKGDAPAKSGPERRTPTDEERRLQQQVEEAKRRGGYRVTDPATQLKTAMDAIKTRLENQISDLEEQIRTRTKIVKERTRLEYDDQANALKARRDELKAVFDEVFPKEPITEAERLARWERHLDRRISDYEDRIKNRDFSKRERKPLPAPREETLARMDKLERLKEQFHEMLLRDKYRNMKLHQKAWVGVKEALNIPRNVMASADVSAVLRQGGMLSASHPVLAARAIVPMLKGMASERMAGIVDQEILNRPNAKSGRYAQAKLYLAPLRSTSLSAMEEQIMSRFAHHIPIVRASNRAFITFLNRIRADSFDLLVENLEKRGKPLTVDETKAIANYINISTGRGDMGRFTAGAEGLATVFFAPRLVTSRFQILAGQPLWMGTAKTRKAIASEYARSLAALGVITTLGLMAGATVEPDPRSAEFGKMRFGNTRLDPMAGLSQTAVLLSRTGVAAANRLAKLIVGKNLTQGEIKTASGKLKMLGATDLRYGERSYADVATTFLRQKLSPVVGGFIDVLTEKNLGGEPVTPGSELATLVTPLSFQDIFNVMKEQGISRGTALMMLSLFGMGLQYYDAKKKPGNRPVLPIYP